MHKLLYLLIRPRMHCKAVFPRFKSLKIPYKRSEYNVRQHARANFCAYEMHSDSFETLLSVVKYRVFYDLKLRKSQQNFLLVQKHKHHAIYITTK